MPCFVARSLGRVARGGELVGRLGGDEFVIAASGDHEATTVAADRYRDALLRRADHEMYRDKPA